MFKIFCQRKKLNVRLENKKVINDKVNHHLGELGYFTYMGNLF